jgi:hypothetical protein
MYTEIKDCYMTNKTQRQLLREANMRGILLVETEDGRLGINNQGRIKIPPPVGSKPPAPDITKCNTIGGKSMKFSEILKAETDKKVAEKQKQEKILSELRFNRRFWEKIAELKAEGYPSDYIYPYMVNVGTADRELQYLTGMRLTPKFFDYLVDVKGNQIGSRSELDIYPTYHEIFERTLKNHRVLVEGTELKIPDDLEIPEEPIREEPLVKDISENTEEERIEIAVPKKGFLSKLKFWK